VAQRRLRSSESVSVLLFQTALQLARNRRLLGDGAAAGSGTAAGSGDPPDAGAASHLAARRAAFLAELRALLGRLDQIEDLAIRRYVKEAVSLRAAD
jgi:hypothetical protein